LYEQDKWKKSLQGLFFHCLFTQREIYTYLKETQPSLPFLQEKTATIPNNHPPTEKPPETGFQRAFNKYS
jgi:hypothetical protein